MGGISTAVRYSDSKFIQEGVYLMSHVSVVGLAIGIVAAPKHAILIMIALHALNLRAEAIIYG